MVEKGRKKGNRLGDANKMNKIKWELEIRLFKRSEDDNDDNLRKDRKKKNIRKKDKNEWMEETTRLPVGEVEAEKKGIDFNLNLLLLIKSN